MIDFLQMRFLCYSCSENQTYGKKYVNIIYNQIKKPAWVLTQDQCAYIKKIYVLGILNQINCNL